MTGEGGKRVVAVLGLGLMGGSLCRALRALAEPTTIVGFDVDPVQGELALKAGAIDLFEPSAEGAILGANTIVYSAPLGATLSMLPTHASLWPEDALVTDLVSLKAPLVRRAESLGVARKFVGAHPICGGAESGCDSARENLFQDAVVWLCASDEVPGELRKRGEEFWSAIGGLPRWSEAEEHDRQMAWISHLPQLVANALAGALDSAGYSPSDLGPGGRDMTRLAGSNPELWKDLLEESAPVTGVGLTSVARALNVLGDLLARREVEKIAEFMERTRRWREEK
jgi:prephenate dehydrogenase